GSRRRSACTVDRPANPAPSTVMLWVMRNVAGGAARRRRRDTGPESRVVGAAMLTRRALPPRGRARRSRAAVARAVSSRHPACSRRRTRSRSGHAAPAGAKGHEGDGASMRDPSPTTQARVARHGGREALALALQASRADTLATFAACESALPDLRVPLRAELNPPLWELG